MGTATPQKRHGRKSIFTIENKNRESLIVESALDNDALDRRCQHRENLANLFTQLNLTLAPVGGRTYKVEQRDWKLRTTALQSPQVRRLYKNLQNRKKVIQSFSRRAEFVAIFKRTERSKEDEWHQFNLEAALSYSPVELVARNLIDKVANAQQRERHGVWAELGKAYACLGLPALSIPKEHVTPKEIEHFDASEKVPQFFQVFHKPSRAHLSLGGISGFPRKKSEQLFEDTQTHLKLQRFLLKMGISHLHDMTQARFPREPLQESEHLRKAVKVKTPFSRAVFEKAPLLPSSGSFSQQLIKLADFRSSSAQRLSSSRTQCKVDEDNQDLPLRGSIRTITDETSNMESSPKGLEPQVFEWIKQFLSIRKGLQEQLNDKLAAQAIRRDQCRSCPPFSAEVSSKLLVQMEENCARLTPALTQEVWRLAEESHKRRRPASMPLPPEVESISTFYEKVCFFVNNQRDDDPLMEVLIHRLKELLESGLKLQKELLSSLCYYMGHLPENVISLGRMTSIMPILHFICKELRVPSSDYYTLLRSSGLDHFQGAARNISAIPNQ